eukprot:Polyplicarium_translucidae@DN2315_c0_g1_i3.p2
MRCGFFGDDPARSALRDESECRPLPPTADGKLTPDCFIIERFIGSGNFCEVFEVTEKSTGRSYAMKMFKKDKVARLQKERDVLMEKHVALKLSDPGRPNVVKLFHSFKKDDTLYLVYELCKSEREGTGRCMIPRPDEVHVGRCRVPMLTVVQNF